MFGMIAQVIFGAIFTLIGILMCVFTLGESESFKHPTIAFLIFALFGLAGIFNLIWGIIQLILLIIGSIN